MNESVSNSNPCTDVNECQLIPSVCGPNSNCTNVNGGHNCSCWDGFTATHQNLTISINNTCTDINECLNSSLVCGPDAYCLNSNGSFSCSCLSGYNVTKMNESVSNSNPCTDVDECQLIPSVCGPNSNCTNVNGGYNCSCRDGFTATLPNLTISINNTCTDINECLNSSLVCGPDAYCLNSNGSFSCSCHSGYNVTKMNESVSNSNPCTDVNECQLIPSVCGPNSNCTNINGGHNCSCWDGFTATLPNLTISISNTCADINECLNSSLVCGPNTYCHNSNGSFSCSCLSGYNVTKMNESVSNSNPCTDVNECQLIPSVCGPNSNCTNVNGGHNCSCWDGFTAKLLNLTISISNTCTDINECLNSSLVCGPDAYCLNSNGSFSCSCLSGYNVTKMNESVSNSNPCTDVNECQLIPSVCGPNSNCTNVNGGHNCSCWDGFTATHQNLTISINNTCTDINECLNSSLVCGPDAYCLNSNGSFSCSCLSGYNVTKMNESVSNSNPCTDVDECQLIPSVCGPNSNCTNVNGGYNCSCRDGFTATLPNLTISINNTCTDINECLNSSLVCGPDAYCLNSNGSFSCSCHSGYNVTKMNESVSNSNPCTDVNECQLIPSVCGPNSNCTNINGGHNCSCWDGFTATLPNLTISISNTCADINECLNSSLVCGPNTYCHNSNGSFSCSCLSGYNVTKMNESVSNSNPCTDVNECQLIPSVCGPNSNCTNINGGHNCSCWDGFTATLPNLTISISNTCADINECLNSSLVCGPNTYCHNSNGSFSCSCLSGYNVTKINESVSNSNPCTDVDECQLIPSVCGPNSNCTNVNGGHNCSCWDGFTTTLPNLTISINNTCTDINECLNSSLVCGPNAYCLNSNGSFSCSCLSGYNVTKINESVSNSNPCTDVNECQMIPSVCGPNSNCQNVKGGYNCSCWHGFTATFLNLPVSINNTCTVYSTLTTQQAVIKMSLTIDKPFDTRLAKTVDSFYKDFAQTIQDAVERSYKSLLQNYKTDSVIVTGFRPGSTIADYTITATNSNLNFTSANENLSKILSSKGHPVAPNGFAQTEQTTLISTSGKFYPQQKLELKCPQSVYGKITWKVNEKEPDSTTYTISDEGGTLKFSAAYSDNGRYSCITQTGSIPYIQWQDISIEPEPSISVGDNKRVFPCDGRTVQLTCYVNEGYSVEWVKNGIVQASVNRSGSITVNHTIPKQSCEEDNFTCQLKGLPKVLFNYDYSMSNVTVKTSTGDFNCQNNTLGFGKTNDMTKGLCESGKEGSITYKCISNVWEIEQDDCVLKVIKDLESKLQGLAVTAIPVFMANLSSAVDQNNASVTQSAATVNTIVKILSNIADLSKDITHNKPVMESFLNTVDIIVSDNSSKTWSNLNKKNTTGNTSVKLLQAIENISDRLSDVFAINLSSIQLIRNQTSQLPNSMTQIVIPDISENTFITVIFLSKLNDVLPTRNSSNNDNSASQNRINGDVVVVKVNETINNISFTFDITNISLGNPQCVFWNFTLDRWDSTGCKVKITGNEGKKVTCECNHTTSFSILMSPPGIDHPALAYITYIGVAISITSLILCLIIEKIVWKSVNRNDTSYMRHVSIVNIALSLLIANICFIIGAAIADQDKSISVGRCSPVVFFMHFFYLAVFFWMLISALLLLYRTVVVLAQMSRTIMRVIGFTVGYGAPLLIAVITVASTAGPKNYVSKENACWLNWEQSRALLAFVIPALTIVFINLVVLIVVVCKILRRGVGTASQPAERHILIVIARCLAFLTPIFGLTWGFGIGTMVSRDIGIHVVFALLNSLQGFFVLVFGILLDGKVREVLGGKLSLSSLSSSPTRSTNPGVSSSSGLGLFARLRRNVYNVSNPSSSRPTNSSVASENLMNP
ncbi:uncharacterized protein LOC130433963 [Triplophysa dalaica]|uniref:uncharacterized protein LOC130433963 n=1 Tax=Triplophysa dalaica TaxID=1582913 RepID=UPI0024DF5F0C|nr:uncharacterized protein LOC130433963 [Triplophysa dalaica]